MVNSSENEILKYNKAFPKAKYKCRIHNSITHIPCMDECDCIEWDCSMYTNNTAIINYDHSLFMNGILPLYDDNNNLNGG